MIRLMIPSPKVCVMIDQLAREPFVKSQLVLPLVQLTAPSLYGNEECDTLWNRVLRICDKYALNAQENRPA
jgi:hypothetical protein